MRYFLELAYKGTNYSGWQVQANAVSIQEKINDALSILAGNSIETLGCGRTDTGVHAKQFFVQFDWKSPIIDPYRFNFQLNGILPNDIVIFNLHQVPDDASARYDAVSRIYEYYIYAKKNPFLRDFACWYPKPLDFGVLNQAASILIGEKDFECFSKSRSDVKHFICTVHEAGWQMEKDLLVFKITANRFLRGMVRAIVGTLLKAGSGEISIQDIDRILENKKRSDAGMSVPAQGLYLSSIQYPFIKSDSKLKSTIFEILK